MNNFITLNLQKLKLKKIQNPEIDLRILLNSSKYSKNEIILSNFNLSQINIEQFNLLLNRRLANEPISKILNKKSFWKDDFFVNKFVLDPRPETEAIIEESLNVVKNKKQNISILDIGTGSGAIAISLAREFINSKITAIDISHHAIKVANKNINKKKFQNQIELKKISIDFIANKFDLIVSNPPYLSHKEIKNISMEIKKFEPLIALDGGEDGLRFYREFAKKIPNIMNKNAYLIIEIGEKQFNNCIEIFSCSGLKLVKKAQDLQKKDRIMVFSKI
jgi:release factor glutamine methyltransferase